MFSSDFCFVLVSSLVIVVFESEFCCCFESLSSRVESFLFSRLFVPFLLVEFCGRFVNAVSSVFKLIICVCQCIVETAWLHYAPIFGCS